MAQRTVTTRLSAAQTARKNLEAQIEELRAEIASRSPPADSEVPPSDNSPPSLPHQVHNRSGEPEMDTPAPGIAQLLHQQQQMMATLVDFLRLTERQPPVTPSLAPRAQSARPWKMDVPVLSSPEDSDLTSLTDWRTRWADYLSLTRAMDGIDRDPHGPPRSPPLCAAPGLDSPMADWKTGRSGRRRYRRYRPQTGALPPESSQPAP